MEYLFTQTVRQGKGLCEEKGITNPKLKIKIYNECNMDTKYMSKVWATEILTKEAEKQIDIMIEALLPSNYVMEIKEGSFENPDNQYQAKYGFQAKLIPNTDSPHWVVNAYSRAGVKARVLVELLDRRPVYPLTK